MIIVGIAMTVALSGCYTEGMGGSILVGEQSALPQISNATGTYAINIYESVKGARVWTRQDSRCKVTYECSYTNDFCGIATFRERMKLTVDLEPLAVYGGETNETATAAE
jgi:hypothetical protein